jgi:Shikimate 5-dehydrogenase
MNKLYVIGNNASKSLSPTIFKYWFKKYKIKATYGYYEINKKFFNKEFNQI